MDSALFNRVRKSEHTPAVCFLAAVNLLFFFRLWFSTSILHGSGTDVVSFQYPMLEWARDELLAGRFPHWNPHIWGGHPFHAMGQAGLAYPVNWLLMLPGAFVWIKLSVAFHALLGSVLAYVLAYCVVREGDVAPRLASPAAVLAGVVYGYSGFVLFHAYAGHINLLASAAWVPGVWLGLWGLSRGDRIWRWFVVLATSVAAIVLAGSPQVLIIALAPGGLWFAGLVVWNAVEADASRRLRLVLVSLGSAVGAVLVGLALAGVQLLPMLRLLSLSARGGVEGEGLALSYSMPWSGFWGLFVPRLWGDLGGVWWARISRWEFAGYVSLATALCGAVALFFERKRSLLLGFAGVVALWLAVGGNGALYPLLVKWLPFLGSFRVPGRFVLVVVLVSGVLGSVGVAQVLAGRVQHVRLGVLGGFVVGVAGVLLLAFMPEKTPGFWASYVGDMTEGQGGKGLVEACAGLVRRDLVREVLLGGALLSFLWAVASSERVRDCRWLRLLPALLVALLLWSSGHGLLSGGPPALYRVPDSAGKLLAVAGNRGRIAYFEDRGWNKVMQHGSYNIGGYDPSISASMNMFINAGHFGERGMAADKVWALWPTGRTHSPTKFWDIAGVGHVVTQHPGRFEKGAWRKVAGDGGWGLYQNPRAARIAYCPENVSAAPDRAGVARTMWSREFVTGESAVIMAEAIEPPASGCKVRKVGAEPARPAFDVEAKGRALVVVQSSHHPEWVCRVDGRDSPSLSTNLVSTGCFVEAGSHDLELVYRPVTFWWGLALTLLSLAGLTVGSAVFTLTAKFRRKRHA